MNYEWMKNWSDVAEIYESFSKNLDWQRGFDYEDWVDYWTETHFEHQALCRCRQIKGGKSTTQKRETQDLRAAQVCIGLTITMAGNNPMMAAPWSSDYVCALVSTSLGRELSYQQFWYNALSPLVSNSMIQYFFVAVVKICLKYLFLAGLSIINKADPTLLRGCLGSRPLLCLWAPPRELASVQLHIVFSQYLEFWWAHL